MDSVKKAKYKLDDILFVRRIILNIINVVFLIGVG